MYRAVLQPALTALAFLAPAARAAHGQGLPNSSRGSIRRSSRRGDNVLHLGIPGRGEVTGVEIALGGHHREGHQERPMSGKDRCLEVTIDVRQRRDAGNRTIVAVSSTGRTAPRRLAVYSHVPKIST